MTEREIQRSICRVLDLHGIVYSVTDASRSFTPSGEIRSKVRKGWPDLTGCFCGRFIAIECKSAKGRLRPEQKVMLARLERAGALTLVARSGNEVHEWLSGLTSKNWKQGKSR